jgi:uncharacterized protein YutE (UPF0331/DUF86 family)
VVAQSAVEYGLVGDPSLAARFVEMAGYRNRLTHHYAEVTPVELFAVVSNHLGDLEAIADALQVAAGRLAG